ncbi:MAG: hypothetical protein COU51_03065 [Parcubacteria group bacterium CG10_big_fil_rev_8_21_14_0_10_36_14]|nr:MAG: hypothetical protein COU51_03065 [Parcubacteria group bacterium CG10_big_fil_rev_8_21_14_0_10_36_14]
MAKKTKKTNKLNNILMIIKQNKLLFTIYSIAVFIILIIMDYWAGFFKLSLELTPFIDNHTQYLHLLPFINLNPVTINFNGYTSISNLTWGGFVIYCLSMILTSLIIGLLLTWFTIKLEKKFNSKKKPFILVFVPFFALSLSVAGLSADIKSHNVSWIPEKITQTVFTGTTNVLNAQLVTKEDLENISLEATPGLENFLIIIPSSFQKIEKNHITDIKLLVTVPANAKIGEYGGTIHIKSIDKSKRTYPQTLKVNLSVEEPTADYIPNNITLPTADRIAEDPAIGQNYIKDEIIVKFIDGTSEAEIKQAVQDIGGVFIGFLKDLEIYQIQVNAIDFSELDQKIAQLEQNSIVDFAGRQIITIPNL